MAENLTPKKYIDDSNMKQILATVKNEISGDNSIEYLTQKEYDNKKKAGELIDGKYYATPDPTDAEILGATDISGIGDGTVSGAIVDINSRLEGLSFSVTDGILSITYDDGEEE